MPLAPQKVVDIGEAADGAERYEDWTPPADNGIKPCRAYGIAFQLYTSGSSACSQSGADVELRSD